VRQATLADDQQLVYGAQTVVSHIIIISVNNIFLPSPHLSCRLFRFFESSTTILILSRDHHDHMAQP
jgi:hypothetical protein